MCISARRKYRQITISSFFGEFLMWHRKLSAIAVSAAVGLIVSTPVHANLVFLEGVTISGAGLGTVNTVLTVASPANSSLESGSVFASGSGFSTSGDALTGAGQVGLPSLSSLGITSAADLRIVFNANEPNEFDAITLNQLVLTFYGTSGNAVGSFGTALEYPFASTNRGIGNAGFVFGLDALQAAEANALLTGSFGSYRVGLFANLSNATGGQETFFVVNVPGVTAPIPEPETYALMLAGLGVVGFVARRRRRAA